MRIVDWSADVVSADLVATVISAANSLTLSPALACVLFKPHGGEPSRFPLAVAGRCFADSFNKGFDRMSEAYGSIVRFLVSRRTTVGAMLLLFAGLLAATVYMLQVTPRGFIPPMDQGYAIVVIQLPPGSSLSRTDAVTPETSASIQYPPGLPDPHALPGFS